MRRPDGGDVADLDALPFPDWDPFPVATYRYAFLTVRGATLPVGSPVARATGSRRTRKG